jgi:hypothetical protein
LLQRDNVCVRRDAYPAVILSAAKNLIQYSSTPAGTTKNRLRRRGLGAAAWMRFFVAKCAPQMV